MTLFGIQRKVYDPEHYRWRWEWIVSPEKKGYTFTDEASAKKFIHHAFPGADSDFIRVEIYGALA